MMSQEIMGQLQQKMVFSRSSELVMKVYQIDQKAINKAKQNKTITMTMTMMIRMRIIQCSEIEMQK
jgi:hypothetical protein